MDLTEDTCMSKNVTIVRSGNNDHLYHAHSAGCRDLSRGYDLTDAYEVAADSKADLVEAVYPRADFGYEDDEVQYYANDIKIFPCVKGIS